MTTSQSVLVSCLIAILIRIAICNQIDGQKCRDAKVSDAIDIINHDSLIMVKYGEFYSIVNISNSDDPQVISGPKLISESKKDQYLQSVLGKVTKFLHDYLKANEDDHNRTISRSRFFYKKHVFDYRWKLNDSDLEQYEQVITHKLLNGKLIATRSSQVDRSEVPIAMVKEHFGKFYAGFAFFENNRIHKFYLKFENATEPDLETELLVNIFEKVDVNLFKGCPSVQKARLGLVWIPVTGFILITIFAILIGVWYYITTKRKPNAVIFPMSTWQ